MAKKVSENAKWWIGIVFTAATLVFGSNLFERFFEDRRIAFDVRSTVPRSGVALLRIVNPSAKTCGPVTVDFTANATLKAAKFRKVRTGDAVAVSGRSAQIDVAQLAARNGRVLIDFEYEGLVSDALEFMPADTEVGCGDVAYSLVEMEQDSPARVWSRWFVVAVLAVVILVVLIISKVMDPFRV
ncbi:MAG TPA: hypothetical protein VGF28_17455 [Thermoanaerobaculia bacterium]|jgi:hypothetical protein